MNQEEIEAYAAELYQLLPQNRFRWMEMVFGADFNFYLPRRSDIPPWRREPLIIRIGVALNIPDYIPLIMRQGITEELSRLQNLQWQINRVLIIPPPPALLADPINVPLVGFLPIHINAIATDESDVDEDWMPVTHQPSAQRPMPYEIGLNWERPEEEDTIAPFHGPDPQQPKTEEELKQERGECIICKDSAIDSRLDCGHPACARCILRWLRRGRTCPVCRIKPRTLHVY